MAKKKKVNLPEGAKEAEVGTISHDWWVRYHDEKREEVFLRVTEEDAWNFDIEKGLRVTIIPHPKDPEFCSIISKRGNKKYVRIETMPDV